MPRYIDFVFDTPLHESLRFLRSEDENRCSVSLGSWVNRGKGLWALRIEAGEVDALFSPPPLTLPSF